jgi:hypothetical protein
MRGSNLDLDIQNHVNHLVLHLLVRGGSSTVLQIRSREGKSSSSCELGGCEGEREKSMIIDEQDDA